MELSDAVQLVIVRRQPARTARGRPTGAGLRTDHQRTELVEREYPVREVAAEVLDPGELDVPARVGGLLPRLGPLKGDPVPVQDLPQPFPTDPDPSGGMQAQVVGELADAPSSEWPAQLSGRALAVATMNCSSSLLILRGRPPAH
ncbi:hypothetical protein GCM10028790_49280 [Micromonospora taraxaci]